MPLATDALLGDHLARLVADRLNAFVATTMRIGCSEHHLEFPGTLSISEDTFHGVVADIVRSSARGGFRRIVLVPLGDGGLHAGEWETSMLEAIHPELVHPDRGEAGYTGDPQAAIAAIFGSGVHTIAQNGVIGDPANWGTPPPAGWALLLSCDEYPTGV